MARLGIQAFIIYVGKAVRVYTRYSGVITQFLPPTVQAAFTALSAVYSLLKALQNIDVE